MAMTVTMPQLGESVTEGTIARWLKQPGEMVAKYESIAEVVTDKVNAEIPAPADGSMGEHIAKEGDVIAVGQPICTIETEEQALSKSAWASDANSGENVSTSGQAAQTPDTQPVAEQPAQPQVEQQEEPAAQPQASQPQPQPQPQPVAQAAQTTPAPAPAQPAPSENGDVNFHVTPAVRMLAREHAVDLGQVTGSGIGGRVTKKDVLEYVQRRDAGGAQPPQQQTQAPAPAAPAPAPQPAAAASPAPSAPARPAQNDELVPMTPIRRSIAEHMVRSKATSPHAWLMMEVDMSKVARLREGRKAEFKQRYGVNLTYLPFVARAVCESLMQHRTMNAQWSDEGLILKKDIHLGIAVALEDNLIVPVVRNADRLTIAGLATTMADLGDRARANKLKLDEIQGGTFTLNNTGALGTVMTQAIINQPQAGILAMDAVIKRPVVVDDAIAIRPIMNIGLSFDHRINDGLQATRFVKTVKELLENIDESSALL